MQVILKKDIKGTGKAGDIVKVSDGYARNRLIPSGQAVEATEANKKTIEREKANLKKKIAEERESASNLAKELELHRVVVKTKIGENGKLFGSITSMDIDDAISEQTGHEIDKKKSDLDKPIKETGVVGVEVKLYQDITAKVNVQIEGGK